MTGFARRPLAVFVCCLFAGAQTSHAAIDAARLSLPAEGLAKASGDAAGGQGLDLDLLPPVQLQLERKFDLLAAKTATTDGNYHPLPIPGIPMPEDIEKSQPKEDTPVFITADRVEGRSDEVTEAEGDAELRKTGTNVSADKITYWPLEDEVEAIGNVHYQQEENEINGPHMRMKLSEHIGFFDDADYKIVKEVATQFYSPKPIKAKDLAVGTTTTTSSPLMVNVPKGYGLPLSVAPRRRSEGYGHAERIDFEGENQISLNEATYSTCKPPERDWYLKAEKMHLDYDEEEGEADDAKVYFKDVPIFYAPSISFPLNNRRKSGILPATFATSTRNGVDLTVPYYWNLAPNYDATFYPRYMSKRGFQLGAETEYLGYNYQGYVKGEYLPDDDIEHRSRYAYGIKHQQALGHGLVLNVNWNGVSDDTYWQDFSSRVLHTSQSQLPRQLALNYAIAPGWNGSLQTLRYQTLNPDPLNPVERPYFIEPQLAVSGRKANYLGLADTSVYAQYTRFSHPDKVEGQRVVAYPQISIPYVDPAFIVVPKFGLHATQYSLDNQVAGSPTSISRVVPTFTLDSSVVFERQGSWMGKEHIQTLEPRLYYVYIPYRNQDKIPVFDSGIADFNFAQIFTENRYTGYDRVNDANQLTAAVTSRFLDAATGSEHFKVMVGQRYYFKEQRVTITGETVRQDNFSDFLAAFNGLMLPNTYFDAAWEYDYHRSNSQRLSLGARFQPELAKVLSAGYRFTRDALGLEQVKQIDIAGQWPIAPRWYGVGRYNFSIRDKQLLEGIAGVEYNAGCWASRFVVQRLEAVGGKPNTTLFFQLELNDFASVGSNPIQLLRRTIPGYGKVNEMPTSGSLLTSE